MSEQHKKIRVIIEYDAIIEEHKDGLLKNVKKIRKDLSEELKHIIVTKDFVDSEDGEIYYKVKVNKYRLKVEEVRGDDY